MRLVIRVMAAHVISDSEYHGEWSAGTLCEWAPGIRLLWCRPLAEPRCHLHAPPEKRPRSRRNHPRDGRLRGTPPANPLWPPRR